MKKKHSYGKSSKSTGRVPAGGTSGNMSVKGSTYKPGKPGAPKGRGGSKPIPYG